ncbi:MAG: membrane protein insertion efficiency factor YidD [Alphaproteobacteria bacterium]|nr:membrane protein insertion efficiency factor YidD [Alphaproteobacteria bacterium]
MSRSVSERIIRLYRYGLSPFFGNQCRFHPTCSAYAQEAIRRHGALKGWCLAALRILNCHPYSRRPWTDPVPERFAWRDFIRYKKPFDQNRNAAGDKDDKHEQPERSRHASGGQA